MPSGFVEVVVWRRSTGRCSFSSSSSPSSSPFFFPSPSLPSSVLVAGGGAQGKEGLGFPVVAAAGFIGDRLGHRAALARGWPRILGVRAGTCGCILALDARSHVHAAVKSGARRGKSWCGGHRVLLRSGGGRAGAGEGAGAGGAAVARAAAKSRGVGRKGKKVQGGCRAGPDWQRLKAEGGRRVACGWAGLGWRRGRTGRVARAV